jgi:hypothetical protein
MSQHNQPGPNGCVSLMFYIIFDFLHTTGLGLPLIQLIILMIVSSVFMVCFFIVYSLFGG